MVGYYAQMIEATLRGVDYDCLAGSDTIMPAIEFEKETLGNILQSRKNLRVPINQRAYKWAKEHVEDLFKDLNGAILHMPRNTFWEQ